MNENIIIQDWTGRILFEGHYNNKAVDKVLDANRCLCDDNTRELCPDCNGTGYKGDFEVYWQDQTINENVYECINY